MEALGIKKPDLFTEVNKIILPKYQVGKTIENKEYYNDIKKILKARKTIPSNEKDKFIEKWSDINFIDSINNITGKHYLRKASEIYFKNKDLKEYFDGYKSIFLVSDKLYKKIGKERLEPFLKELGVENKPKRIEIQSNLSKDEHVKIQGEQHSKYGHEYATITDYEYEGLENFIKDITVKKSLLLWRLLLKNIEQRVDTFFRGEYCWFFRYQHKSFIEPKFLKTLKSKSWLFNKNNKFVKPNEITFSELPNKYTKDNENIDILLENLEFNKPNVVVKLPENDQLIKDLKDKGYSGEDIKNFPPKNTKKAELQQKDKVNSWIPECQPNQIDVKIEKVELVKNITPDLKDQAKQLEKNKSIQAEKNKRSEIEADIIETQNYIDRQKIGNWGEEYVYESLKKEYEKKGTPIKTDFGFKTNYGNEKIEIVWLNKPGNIGKGYDFVAKKNGIEIEYIEVKAKTGKDKELIEITGTQWEFARKLYDQGKGEKYVLYVVYNAGKSNAEIKMLRNPIKLWKDGNLYAHPINFKL